MGFLDFPIPLFLDLLLKIPINGDCVVGYMR